MKAFGGLLIALLALTFCACKPRMPKGVLSESDMERLLYDYHLAQTMGELSGDSMAFRRTMYTEAVFKKYGITEADFDSSIVWYTRHADRLYKIYDRLSKRYADEATALGGSVGDGHFYAELSNTGDTANIWDGRRFYVLTPSRYTNRITFTQEADTTFYVHDKFVWNFTPTFIYKEGARRAVAGLVVRYSNDSVSASTIRVQGDGNVSLTVEADTGSIIREVSGFVYLSETSEDPRKLIFLNNLSLIRFHQPKVAAKSVQKDTIPASEMNANTPRRVGTSSVDTSGNRLTPDQFREALPVERKIDIVKEKPYRMPPTGRQPNNGSRRRRRQ